MSHASQASQAEAKQQMLSEILKAQVCAQRVRSMLVEINPLTKHMPQWQLLGEIVKQLGEVHRGLIREKFD